MANSILNSDDGSVSGSAGLKFTAGDDGVLKIQNNGTDALTVSDAGVVTFAQQPVNPVPAFHVDRETSAQSFSSITPTKIQFNRTVFDTNSYWDAGNYRYIPQIAGYYYFFGMAQIEGTSITQTAVYIYKNGTIFMTGPFYTTSTATVVIAASVHSHVYMNGSTDYVELWGYSNGTPTFRHAFSTMFQGFLVRAA